MGALADILEAVKAMRTIAVESPEELGNRLEDVASELLFAVAEALIDENGVEGAMCILHSLDSNDLEYDEFIGAVLAYRRPIIGDEEPDDWEYPFYAMLMLTEPTIKEERDER